MDEGFIGAPKRGKRERGSAKNKALFAVQYRAYKGHNMPQFIAVETRPDFTGSTFKAFANNKITAGSILVSDGFSSYSRLSSDFSVATASNNSDDERSPLKLVHLFISNTKALFQGTYHGLGAKHMQGYFTEFAYRFNRSDSRIPIVEHLLCSCVRAGYTAVPELCI